MNEKQKRFGRATADRPFGTLAVVLCAAILSSCTRIPDGIVPVSGFEVSRYLGTWHEIMRLDHRFERGLSHVTATYGRNDDGTVSVVNRGLDRDTCEWNSVKGHAKFIGDPRIGSLAVTFFWPITGGYHIFALDKDNYQWAAVSGPSRDYLWILSRQPELDASIRNRLVDKAKSLGFAVDELIEVEHGPTDCSPGES